MSAFLNMVKAIEDNKQLVIDDETGATIKIFGVGHVIKRVGNIEHAVALFKDEHTILRGLYIDEEDNKPHLDVWTVGGVVYAVEELVDLQHHPLMGGTLFQTYIFGMPNGGCTPRPAPTKEAKAEVKKDDKAKEKEAVVVPQPRQRNTGLGRTPIVAKQTTALTVTGAAATA